MNLTRRGLFALPLLALLPTLPAVPEKQRCLYVAYGWSHAHKMAQAGWDSMGFGCCASGRQWDLIVVDLTSQPRSWHPRFVRWFDSSILTRVVPGGEVIFV